VRQTCIPAAVLHVFSPGCGLWGAPRAVHCEPKRKYSRVNLDAKQSEKNKNDPIQTIVTPEMRALRWLGVHTE
jgi:hypothetical protein